jgi:hypothetical protein
MEAGTHSIWISEQIEELGHEVIVANVRELRAISHSDRKSDQVDAEKLARFARLDPQILRPITHRTVQQQEALTLIRARDLIVRLRTAAVNAVRGLTKSCGYRMPASSTRCFAKRSLAVMPPGLAQALGPVLEQIAEMTIKIKHYDRQIQQLAQTTSTIREQTLPHFWRAYLVPSGVVFLYPFKSRRPYFEFISYSVRASPVGRGSRRASSHPCEDDSKTRTRAARSLRPHGEILAVPALCT